MNAREFLNQLRKLDNLIQNKIAEKEQWKSISKNITPLSNGERVQASSEQQKMADAVIKYIDLETEIEKLIDLLVDKRKEIISIIEQVDNSLQYNVLNKHYVQYKPFTVIAEEEHYSYAYILEIHRKSLKEVEKILQNPILSYDNIVI